MVEPAALVAARPFAVAVAPPGIELFVFGDDGADRIDPSMGSAPGFERLDFDRRVADDLQQLLVRPDIVFMRRDVEIADHDVPTLFGQLRRPVGRFFQKIHFVGELVVHLGVRLVATGGHIEIMQEGLPADIGRDMAAVFSRAPVAAAAIRHRRVGQNGNAVIALHAA